MPALRLEDPPVVEQLARHQRLGLIMRAVDMRRTERLQGL
jgi:hypothetical protein